MLHFLLLCLSCSCSSASIYACGTDVCWMGKWYHRSSAYLHSPLLPARHPLGDVVILDVSCHRPTDHPFHGFTLLKKVSYLQREGWSKWGKWCLQFIIGKAFLSESSFGWSQNNGWQMTLCAVMKTSLSGGFFSGIAAWTGSLSAMISVVQITVEVMDALKVTDWWCPNFLKYDAYSFIEPTSPILQMHMQEGQPSVIMRRCLVYFFYIYETTRTQLRTTCSSSAM